MDPLTEEVGRQACPCLGSRSAANDVARASGQPDIDPINVEKRLGSAG